MSVRVELNLTKREADAVLRALNTDRGGLTLGWGVRKPQALQTAETKIAQAIRMPAERATSRPGGPQGSNPYPSDTHVISGRQNGAQEVGCDFD